MMANQGIYIALGSNLPFEDLKPVQILQQAVQLMPRQGIHVLKASAIYETPPFPVADQPNFANAVIDIKTDLSARDVLKACLDIEQKFDRSRATRWGARTLDLDVLAYNEKVTPSHEQWYTIASLDDAVEPELVVPHPRLHKRAFALIPLLDIAPNWQHPVLGQPIDMICKQNLTDAECLSLQKISEKLL